MGSINPLERDLVGSKDGWMDGWMEEWVDFSIAVNEIQLEINIMFFVCDN